MEQIEKLSKLVNMEPVLVIIIGVGAILIIFSLAAIISSRRRKRIVRSRDKALKKIGNVALVASSCQRISEPFATILRACSELPGGEDFLQKEEVASALRELAGTLTPSNATPRPKKKKGARDLSLRDYSSPPAGDSSGEGAKKSMVRIIRAIYMERQLLQALKQGHPGELKETVEFLTE